MMDNMFPRMKTMMNSEPDAPTECQDLMGMSFRTFHFDGVVRVPGYIAWLMQCDMRETYDIPPAGAQTASVALPADPVAPARHRCTCSPSMHSSRHIRMPNSCGAIVIRRRCSASVCSLIAYIRSWSSDRKDPHELGAEQLAWWAEGIRRAMDFRKRFGDNRFVDVSFADLQTDPVETLERSYARLGLTFTDGARAESRSGRTGTSQGRAASTATISPTTA